MTDEITYPDPCPRVQVDDNSYRYIAAFDFDCHSGHVDVSECQLCFALIRDNRIDAHMAAIHPETVQALPEVITAPPPVRSREDIEAEQRALLATEEERIAAEIAEDTEVDAHGVRWWKRGRNARAQ